MKPTRTVPNDYFRMYKHGRCIVCRSPIASTLHQAADVYRDDFSMSDSIYNCRTCGTGYSYPFYTVKKLNKLYKNYSGYTHDDNRGSNAVYKAWVYAEQRVMAICLSPTHIFLKKVITSPLFAYLFQTYPIFSVKTSNGIKILDIGCGGGHFLRVAQKAGAETYGTEIDRTLVSTLREHGIKAYLNIDTIAKLHTKFDIIRLNHVVEHLVDPNIELRKIHSLLKKEGQLIIGLPNYETLARICGRFMFLHLPFHRTHHTKRGLKELLKNNGFHVVYMRTKSTGVLSRSILRIFRQDSSIYTVPFKLFEIFVLSPILDLFNTGDSIELYAKKEIAS